MVGSLYRKRELKILLRIGSLSVANLEIQSSKWIVVNRDKDVIVPRSSCYRFPETCLHRFFILVESCNI